LIFKSPKLPKNSVSTIGLPKQSVNTKSQEILPNREVVFNNQFIRKNQVNV
jgi:hypothetical protein